MNILNEKRRLLPMGNYLGGGSGGGSSGPSESKVYNTNIPEYAQPYVETMLGTAQQQVYNYDANGQPTGMKPYQPFSTDPSKYFAGFSPMQQQSFQGAANMTTAPQLDQATGLAGIAGLGGLGVANQANVGGFQSQMGGYMNPYLQQSLAPQLEMMRQQQGQQATQRAGQATQAGAFGGSRFGLQNAQAGLNDQLAQQNLIGQGYNQAFGQAQQQYNQNLQNQLAGYGAAGQAAGALGQLGQTKYGQQVGNINLQNQMGGQQQQQQQGIINQQVQDYATAQQYPMMQLGNMSNLLRGLPMQSTTVQSYQAPPNPYSQLGGMGMAAVGAMNKYGKKGGQPKDFEKRPAGLAELAISKLR
jgi:hypothetical protein